MAYKDNTSYAQMNLEPYLLLDIFEGFCCPGCCSSFLTSLELVCHLDP